MSQPERWTPVYDRLFQDDHDFADEPACRRWAWIDLCHMAQWKDGVRVVNGTIVELPRGTFLASIRFLAKRWNWPKSKVHRYLELLQDPRINKIGTETETPAGTVYRIVKYDTYANPGDTQRDTQRDERGTAAGQRRDKEHTVTTSTYRRRSAAAAVGEFCERTGSEWRLDKGISEWVEEIESDPTYAGAELHHEIRKATDWHVGRGNTPKAPDMSLRNWLKKAADDAKREHKSQRPRKTREVDAETLEEIRRMKDNRPTLELTCG